MKYYSIYYIFNKCVERDGETYDENLKKLRRTLT